MKNSNNLATINSFPTLFGVGAKMTFQYGNDVTSIKVKLPNGNAFDICQMSEPNGMVGPFSVVFADYEYCQRVMKFSKAQEVEKYILGYLKMKIPT